MVAELCIDVINGFKHLKDRLNSVTEHVCQLDHHLPAWFQPPLSMRIIPGSTLRQQACELLSQLEYLDGQQPREILVGAGIIASSDKTLKAVHELNLAKEQFKQAMLKLKAAKVSPNYEILAHNFEQLLSQRDAGVASNLKRMGLGRVHLKQCYRKIPFYTQRPRKVSWTWANTRSIKKITVAQASVLLQQLHHDAGIERQLMLLQGLEPNEKLAIVQELAPHLRANIVMPTSDGESRIMVKGPIPIFYLANDNSELPDFAPPGIKRGKDKERAVRKDVKINPEPFLPAIRAHRYY